MKANRFLLALATTTTLLSAPAVMAQSDSEFKVNRVSVQYSAIEDVSGPGISGLARVSDKIFIGASYNSYDYDDINATSTMAGGYVGYGTDSGDGVVFVAVGAGSIGIDVCAFNSCADESFTYYTLSYNQIAEYTENMEMQFSLTGTFFTEDEIDNELSLSLGLGYTVTDNIVISANGSVNDSGDFGYGGQLTYRF